MPARQRPVDPRRDELAAFAHDLRKLSAGKATVPYISAREPKVSRAALYAALSGLRLPSARTLSTLLRWWAVEPPLTPDPGAWPWNWVQKLPSDSPAVAIANQWIDRRDDLAGERLWPADRAAPVTIPPPTEQLRFAAELGRVLEARGLLPGVLIWDDFYEEWHTAVSGHQIQRYLNHRVIPSDDTLAVLLSVDEEDLEDLPHLLLLARAARAARVRGRRAARQASTRHYRDR
ncbi:hypothetical protein [Streptomyces natalensis]|uniref:hypothetical protein n=1 Tax=Streptomyces natalensis TaxID=68242 RepID=UPI000B2BFBAC|nr:hypothetical protein [Streptomyces natalensis]